MTPVTIISMPHNHRSEIYPEGEGPSFDAEHVPGAPRMPVDGTAWAELPIPMPERLTATTDHTGRVIGAEADGRRVRWKDLDIVVRGVEQYNADCASRDGDV